MSAKWRSFYPGGDELIPHSVASDIMLIDQPFLEFTISRVSKEGACDAAVTKRGCGIPGFGSVYPTHAKAPWVIVPYLSGIHPPAWIQPLGNAIKHE